MRICYVYCLASSADMNSLPGVPSVLIHLHQHRKGNKAAKAKPQNTTRMRHAILLQKPPTQTSGCIAKGSPFNQHQHA